MNKDKAKYASLFTSCLTAIALYSIFSLNWMIPVASGILIYFILFYKTKYNQCQHQLRNEEIHYRNLLNLTPNAIFVHKGGAISFVNKKTLQLLQITMDDVVGKPIIDFIHPDYRKELINYCYVPANKRNELSMEAQLLRKDGQEITVEITLTPITYNGEPAILGVFRDISERKQNDGIYSSSLCDVSTKKMELEMMLRGAIERKEFILHYQPLVTLDSGQLTGMEALIRWKHPVRGIISPAEFIPLAEETGLIVPIGEWVLKKALSQMKIWKDQGYTSLRLAVNVSPHQIKYGNLPNTIETLLKETGFEPEKLELEITESIFMQSTEDIISVLHQLKGLGVNISIDDFGIGFSSLGYLKSFPIDHLKIDQTFVKDCMNYKDQAIISTIISLAKQLNLNVIAEGVESDLQFAFLKDKLCNEAQGYLFSKPLSPIDFELTFLKNQNVLM